MPVCEITHVVAVPGRGYPGGRSPARTGSEQSRPRGVGTLFGSNQRDGAAVFQSSAFGRISMWKRSATVTRLPGLPHVRPQYPSGFPPLVDTQREERAASCHSSSAVGVIASRTRPFAIIGRPGCNKCRSCAPPVTPRSPNGMASSRGNRPGAGSAATAAWSAAGARSRTGSGNRSRRSAGNGSATNDPDRTFCFIRPPRRRAPAIRRASPRPACRLREFHSGCSSNRRVGNGAQCRVHASMRNVAPLWWARFA